MNLASQLAAVAETCTPRLDPAHRRGVAIIGAGTIVDVAHLPAYRQGDVRVVGLYDIATDRAREVASRHGISRVYPSIEELLGDEQVDVVDVAVPAAEQPPIVRRALAAGKHLLCQKPFATSVETATELTDLAENAGLTIAVNQQLRYDEGIAVSREMVAGGWIGEPAAMWMNINIHTDFGAFPRLRELKQFEVRYHSIHYFDAVRSILGTPARVFCTSGRRPGQTVRGPTRTVATLSYPDDRVAFVHVNHENQEGDAEAAFRIDGSAGAIKGTIGIGATYQECTPDTIALRSNVLPTSGWVPYPVSRRWFPDAFLGPMANLLQALATGEEPATSARDNLRTLALIEALNESMRTGAAVDINTPDPQE